MWKVFQLVFATVGENGTSQLSTGRLVKQIQKRAWKVKESEVANLASEAKSGKTVSGED
jgi:hypothetical protein